jgi:hypothetical protein
MMTYVFVAGSRAISRLNEQVRERLDNMMRQNFTILVGDANGADKAMQQYLHQCGYREVLVYCMETCRNNVGQWPAKSHTAKPGSKRDRHYYGIKDAAMAEDATCGFMLWDGESKGTLTNVVNLLNAHKKCLLYLSTKKLFFKLLAPDDFYQALHTSGIDNVPGFLASIGIKEPVTSEMQFAKLG